MTKEITMTADELGDLLGLSGRRIRELAAAGTIVRSGRGYPVLESVRRYVASLKMNEAGRRARIELLKRQTQRQELQLRREQGQILTAAEAAEQAMNWWGTTWAAMSYAVAGHYHVLSMLPENKRRELCYAIYHAIAGELRLARDRIKFVPAWAPPSLDEYLEKLGITTPNDGEDDG